MKDLTPCDFWEPFWFSPDWATPMTEFFKPFKEFKTEYIQGVLERVFSALIVTCFVTGHDLFMKYREINRNRPIVWNAGIEPNKPTRN